MTQTLGYTDRQLEMASGNHRAGTLPQNTSFFAPAFLTRTRPCQVAVIVQPFAVSGMSCISCCLSDPTWMQVPCNVARLVRQNRSMPIFLLERSDRGGAAALTSACPANEHTLPHFTIAHYQASHAVHLSVDGLVTHALTFS